VFLTSQSWIGNNINGLSGAHAKCQSLASAAKLTGTYKAWLSDASSGPKDFMSKKSTPYKLTNGAVVANSWSDLTDGTIQTGITIDETGKTSSASGMVATGRTGIDGSKSVQSCYGGGCHCVGWKSGTLAHADSSRPGTPVNYGTSGSGVASKGATNKQWTDYSFWNGCVSGTFTLMCFQQ